MLLGLLIKLGLLGFYSNINFEKDFNILFIFNKNNPAKTIIVMNFQMITYFCLLIKINVFLIIKSEKKWPI